MTSNDVKDYKRPCGFEYIQRSSNPNQVKTFDGSMLNSLIHQSTLSINRANEFRETYADAAFRMKWDIFHELHQDNKYHWLPGHDILNKKLDEPTKSEHLNKAKLETSLYKSYEYMQRVAVGLEQIIADTNDFKQEFVGLLNSGLLVLCEIQLVMLDLNLPKRPDIERNIMPDEARQLDGDNTSKIVRNYAILRDYINTLQYIKECFEHLRTKKY